jgi:endonuclease/exonuclease/phosphatase family metal-dependent hydrolase
VRHTALLQAALLFACERDVTPPGPPGPPPPRTDLPSPPALPPDLPAAPTLRVATYNILAAKRGVDEIVATLADIDADLVALQEVDRNTRRFGRVDLPALLGDRLGLQHAFVKHRRYDGGEIGVALLSRFAISDVKRIATRGSELGVLSASVATDHSDVHVFVVHFHPTDPRKGDGYRARMNALRLREAQTTAARAASIEAPTIVLGDFNALASGPEHALFEAIMTDACPGVATWPAELPLIRIDYIWLSKQFAVDACPVAISVASDHRPVVTNVRLP